MDKFKNKHIPFPSLIALMTYKNNPLGYTFLILSILTYNTLIFSCSEILKSYLLITIDRSSARRSLIKVLPKLAWVKAEAATKEIDRDFEMLFVSIPTGPAFDGHDLAV